MGRRSKVRPAHHVHTFVRSKVMCMGWPPYARRTDAPSRRALEEAVRHWARGAAVATGSENTMLIAHDDPVALAQTARHASWTRWAPRPPGGAFILRVALHYSEVQMPGSTGDAPRPNCRPERHHSMRSPSRAPSCSPDEYGATEDFRQRLAQKPSLWRTTEMMSPDEIASTSREI